MNDLEEFADRFMKSIGEPGCDLQALVDELMNCTLSSATNLTVSA
jgi:hypothetical protein